MKNVVYASRLENTSTTLTQLKMLPEPDAILTVFTPEMERLEFATALLQETWHLNVKIKMMVRLNIRYIFCITIS